jgi:serine/threonine protein kinase
MVSRQWAAGDVLAEKYRLVHELGRGGMGAVWRAEHLVLRADVAVKLVLTAVATSEPLRARFLREAQASAALRSPHVVQILDYGVHQDTPFMVMELLEGESLRQRLARMGVLSAEETARVVVHVARALAKAQEAGIVHRDLKARQRLPGAQRRRRHREGLGLRHRQGDDGDRGWRRDPRAAPCSAPRTT